MAWIGNHLPNYADDITYPCPKLDGGLSIDKWYSYLSEDADVTSCTRYITHEISIE